MENKKDDFEDDFDIDELLSEEEDSPADEIVEKVPTDRKSVV